jgi:hypothetical protein
MFVIATVIDDGQRTCLGYLVCVRAAIQSKKRIVERCHHSENTKGGVSHVYEGHSKSFRVCNETNLWVAGAIADRIRPERRFAMGRPDPFLRNLART